MMPELGKYAGAVLSAYGVSLFLIVGLVAVSILRARAAKRLLNDVEARRKGGNHG